MAACDTKFGPKVDTACRSFDFTLYFEDVVFAAVPSAVFIILAVFGIGRLLTHQNMVKTTLLLRLKLATYIILAIFQAAFLALRHGHKHLHTDAALAADILSLLATMVAAVLSWLQHHQSEQPSTILILYLSVLPLLETAEIRTLYLIPGSSLHASIKTICLILSAAALFLESRGKRASLREPEKLAHSGPEPFIGLWGLAAYVWVLGTLSRGYRSVLAVDDLPDLDYRLSSDKLRHILESKLDKADLTIRNAFLGACGRAYAWPLAFAVLPRLFLIALRFAQPFLINNALEFIENSAVPQSIGNGLIGAYALVYAGMAFSSALHRYYVYRFIVVLRGGLISVIYKHTTRARAVDLGEIDGLTLMGADVERICVSFQNIHELWAAPIEIALVVYLLERKIAIACIVPGLLILFFILIVSFLGSLAKKYQREWIEKVQERLKLTVNTLSNMRSVKMLGLSSRMFDAISESRKIEIQHSARYRWTLIGQIVLSNAPLILAPVVTFIVFVTMANARHDSSFLANKAFTSLSLISLLTNPALSFIQTIPSIYQCLSCFDRMQEYCRQSVHLGLIPTKRHKHRGGENSSDISSQELPLQRETPNDPAVTFDYQSFAWGKADPPTLRNLKGRIMHSRFTAVVGRTGSGKSTLLESILGETVSTSGVTKRGFATAAYCSQIPWLVKGTLKHNVTYDASGPVDEVWYNTVIAACGLELDIQNLVGGDLAEIGDCGSLLSGGQKQRVSLARAVFSRKPVILLDDVFSGVDNRNIAHISEKLFRPGGLLRRSGSTIVLVTHSKYLMMMADDVLVLDQGAIVESRTVASLKELGHFSSGFQIEQAEADADTGDQQTADVRKTVTSNAEILVRNEMGENLPGVLHDEDTNSDHAANKKHVYRYYMRSSGMLKVFMMFVLGGLYIFVTEFGIVWIDLWSSANSNYPGHANNSMYLGVYACAGVLSVVFLFLFCWIIVMDMISTSSKSLHTDMLTAVCGASLYFFQKSDVGNITNRFSQDMELIGIELPMIIVNYLASVYACLAKVILLAIFGRYLTASLPIFLAAVYIIQRVYLRTSRQVRLIDIEAKAPVYLQFVETKNGANTIRSFGWQKRCEAALQKVLDRSQRAVYLLYCIQQWLALVLDLLVSFLVTILVAIVVTWRDKFSSGSVGVSLVTVMTFNFALALLIKMWTSLETSIGAVARIKDFKEQTLPEETILGIRQPESPPDNWPNAGNIEFNQVVASYKVNGPPALKGLTMSIKGGEKVAICGHSGSGKTSLILSLLHMIHLRGELTIDGVDIHDIVPDELRARINIVPQEPFLMPGSVRDNIDPFGVATDAAIVAALRRLGLWERVEAAGGITATMPLTSWSVGERQLFCMARAMARDSPILILDEATSSVDHKTENIMQEVLETEFVGKTVLSIVHRLGYIERYDKVAVLQMGELVEFDVPATLLAQPSMLSVMRSAGACSSNESNT